MPAERHARRPNHHHGPLPGVSRSQAWPIDARLPRPAGVRASSSCGGGGSAPSVAARPRHDWLSAAAAEWERGRPAARAEGASTSSSSSCGGGGVGAAREAQREPAHARTRRSVNGCVAGAPGAQLRRHGSRCHRATPQTGTHTPPPPAPAAAPPPAAAARPAADGPSPSPAAACISDWVAVVAVHQRVPAIVAPTATQSHTNICSPSPAAACRRALAPTCAAAHTERRRHGRRR
eukprot:COSAG01_NODE_1460_length_10242_cov_285.193631_5_plen_235_part_00